MKAQKQFVKSSEMCEKLRKRIADGHKGTFGHALLVCGSRGMAGAAVLSAEACLRSGVGKLSVLTSEENRMIMQISVPEAVLANGFEVADRYQALGIGPGMGLNAGLFSECLRWWRLPMVIDADAINVLAANPDLLAAVPCQSVLTPHPGEAVRLIGSSSVDAVTAFAIEHGVNVVLKGHPTHVCMSDGNLYVLEVGNSGMATAGSGDVLTGLITGFMTQGYTPQDAALLGVWLHGRAGDHAASHLTEHCMLARDIIRHLPDAVKELRK